MRSEQVTLNEALEDYYELRRPRYAVNTWEAHEAKLETFRAWITRETQPNVYLADISDRHLARYMDRYRPPAYSAATYNNYRGYLKMFFDFCVTEGWIRASPMRHVDPARVQRRVRLQLSRDELVAMLDGATPRDRIALALGMNLGLRAGEITLLTVGDVNLTDKRMTMWEEKKARQRELPLTSDLVDELTRWFEHYAKATGKVPETLPNPWTLVPPAQGVAVNVHDMAAGHDAFYKVSSRYVHPEEIVHRALARIGHATRGEGFHTIRRSASRVLFDTAVEQGIPDPIRMPQTLLGHSRRDMTERYLGITHETQVLEDMMRGKSLFGQASEGVVREIRAV